MKFRYELVYKEVYVENLKLGTITDVILDPEEWTITHLAIKMTKEATKEILGAKKSFYNTLAISAVGPASNAVLRRIELTFKSQKDSYTCIFGPINEQNKI